MIGQDEDIQKVFISRYQQGIFALALYLIGGNRDKAYDITVASFVEALRTTPLPQNTDQFLIKLTRATIEQCQGIKLVPLFNDSDFGDLPSTDKKSLAVVRAALQLLPLETKIPILLRDQLHFSYQDISFVLDISEHNAKIQTIQAHSQLRTKIAEVMNHEQ